MTDDRQLVLRHVPFSGSLCGGAREVGPFAQEASYRKNEVLFRTNDPGTPFYLTVGAGQGHLDRPARAGGDSSGLAAGEIFGEMAVLDGYPAPRQ